MSKTLQFLGQKFKYVKRNKLIKPFLLAYRKFKYDKKKFASSMVIELTTICTRKCIYCPHAWIKRERAFMDDKLFKKIIDDLAKIKFKGEIDLVPDGEAMFDKRLSSLIRYIKQKLPKNIVEVMSNGDLLTKDKFDELIEAGADRFNVSRHLTLENGKYVVLEPKTAVKTYKLLNKNERKKIRLFDQDNLRRANEKDFSLMFHNRCGYIPLERTIHKDEFRGPGCLSPSNYMHINYNGDVLLCCRQWSGSKYPVFGNLKKENIKDIWNKPKYKRARVELALGKYKFDICKNCLYGYLPDPKKMQTLHDKYSKNK